MPPTSTTRRSLRAPLLALGLGLVVLALVVVFAVILPRAEGDTALGELPDTISGGWVALEDSPPPAGADPASYTADEEAALAFVNRTLGDVYAEPTRFRAYVNGDQILTATLFDAPGGAFAPPNGVADPQRLGLDRAPVELTRHGDAVCIANYQSAATTPGQSAADPTPLSVSCQAPYGGESTLQIGTIGLGVDETVTLLGGLGADV